MCLLALFKKYICKLLLCDENAPTLTNGLSLKQLISITIFLRAVFL